MNIDIYRNLNGPGSVFGVDDHVRLQGDVQTPDELKKWFDAVYQLGPVAAPVMPDGEGVESTAVKKHAKTVELTEEMVAGENLPQPGAPLFGEPAPVKPEKKTRTKKDPDPIKPTVSVENDDEPAQLAINTDGTGSFNKTAYLWNPSTGKVLVARTDEKFTAEFLSGLSVVAKSQISFVEGKTHDELYPQPTKLPEGTEDPLTGETTFAEETYWHHSESDSYFFVAAGEGINLNGVDMGFCDQLTREQYEEQAQVKIGEDNWVTFLRPRYMRSMDSDGIFDLQVGTRTAHTNFKHMVEITKAEYDKLSKERMVAKTEEPKKISYDMVQKILGEVKDKFGVDKVRALLADNANGATRMSAVAESDYPALHAAAEKELKANGK